MPAQMSEPIASFLVAIMQIGQLGATGAAFNDMHPIDGRAGDIGQELPKRLVDVRANPDRRGGGDEVDVSWRDAEREAHPAKQECDLRGVRPDVGVRLIQDDIAKLALRARSDRRVLWPEQHVFEHGHVRDQDGRRRFPQHFAVLDALGSGEILALL